MHTANLNWDGESLTEHFDNKLLSFAVDEHDFGTDYLPVTAASPFLLAAKSAASKDNNPKWQAMKGPFADEYWKAAQVEVATLEAMDAWTVVDKEDGMNVLPSTWDFKCKRFPEGSVKKFKG